MPRKVFVAGEILTAADVNTNLMDQAVMVFDDSAARGSAIPTPSEGMVTYLKDTNAVEKYDGSAFVNVDTGKILQVVTVEKTDTFTTSSTSYVDVTGLSLQITPSSASSKVLVLMDVKYSSLESGTLSSTHLDLVRSATSLGRGNLAGNRVQAISSVLTDDRYNTQGGIWNAHSTLLDSPATTSATTYKVRARVGVSGELATVNRSGSDADSAASARVSSRITLMEVAG
jgi:hypothetical protein